MPGKAKDADQEPDAVEAEAVAPEVDRVAMPSIGADGEPAQSPGFEILPDPSA